MRQAKKKACALGVSCACGILDAGAGEGRHCDVRAVGSVDAASFRGQGADNPLHVFKQVLFLLQVQQLADEAQLIVVADKGHGAMDCRSQRLLCVEGHLLARIEDIGDLAGAVDVREVLHVVHVARGDNGNVLFRDAGEVVF